VVSSAITAADAIKLNKVTVIDSAFFMIVSLSCFVWILIGEHK